MSNLLDFQLELPKFRYLFSYFSIGVDVSFLSLYRRSSYLRIVDSGLRNFGILSVLRALEVLPEANFHCDSVSEGGAVVVASLCGGFIQTSDKAKGAQEFQDARDLRVASPQLFPKMTGSKGLI